MCVACPFIQAISKESHVLISLWKNACSTKIMKFLVKRQSTHNASIFKVDLVVDVEKLLKRNSIDQIIITSKRIFVIFVSAMIYCSMIFREFFSSTLISKKRKVSSQFSQHYCVCYYKWCFYKMGIPTVPHIYQTVCVTRAHWKRKNASQNLGFWQSMDIKMEG